MAGPSLGATDYTVGGRRKAAVMDLAGGLGDRDLLYASLAEVK